MVKAVVAAPGVLNACSARCCQEVSEVRRAKELPILGLDNTHGRLAGRAPTTVRPAAAPFDALSASHLDNGVRAARFAFTHRVVACGGMHALINIFQCGPLMHIVLPTGLDDSEFERMYCLFQAAYCTAMPVAADHAWLRTTHESCRHHS